MPVHGTVYLRNYLVIMLHLILLLTLFFIVTVCLMKSHIKRNVVGHSLLYKILKNFIEVGHLLESSIVTAKKRN